MEKETPTTMTPATKNKIVYGVLAAILVVVFLLGRGCGIRSVLKTVGTVKTVTKDSLIYRDTGSIVPFRVEHYSKGKDGLPYPVYDTLWGTPEIIIEPADTAAILARFYETAHYKHDIDTGRWKITVEESVTQNRIKDWSLKAVSSDTATVNTVQLKPPRPIVLSFVTSLQGNVKHPFYEQGIGLSLKMPNDAEYMAQIFRVQGQKQPMIQVTKTWPIRLTKRK